MNNRCSAFSIIVIFSCLTILGFFFIPKLSMKLNPSRKHPIVNISYSMKGQSARVIESEVTSKLEAMLNRMKGIQSINSYSKNGSGSITVYLSEHTDSDIARFEMSTIVRQAWSTLPEGVTYPRIYMSGTSEKSNTPFLSYIVNAPYSSIEIQDYLDEILRPKLAEVKGIDMVSITGANRYIYKLEYDFFQLQNYNLTTGDITRAINTYVNKEFLGLGKLKVDSDNDEYIRLSIEPSNGGGDFDASQIQVVNKDSKIIYLDQLVTVSYEEEEANSYHRINGLNSIYLSITAEDRGNQLIISKEVQDCIEHMKIESLADYEFHIAYNQADYIEKELSKIYMRTGLTILILLTFVILVYRNIKYSLIIVLSLIANVSIAVIFYYLLSIEMHIFSLAGLTISLTLIIDNIIIMSDQIVQQGNRKAFMSILTATITTIGSLSIIFFMDKNIQLNLFDFALLIIINLTLSLIIALTLVPALIEKIGLSKKRKKKRKTPSGFRAKITGKRWVVYFNRLYKVIIFFLRKKKVKIALLIVTILIFGLPVFLLPDKLGTQRNFYSYNSKEESEWESLYNKTLGSLTYKEHIKPIVDVALGGTMRLFVQKVKNGSYSSDERSETTLHVAGTLPYGSTRDQMDALIRKMETFISQFEEVRQYETYVQKGRANIKILFHKEYQKGSFPYLLQSELISKANELGGGSWSIYGVGDGFNNEVRDNAGSSRIKLLGYNYDQLMSLAFQMRDSLLQHRRIQEVNINSEFSYYKSDYEEFVFDLKKEMLAEANILPLALYNSLTPIFQRDMYVNSWVTDKESTPVKLYSKQSEGLNLWDLENYSGKIGEKEFKISELVSIEKSQVPQSIAKENQQYRLCIQYEYIGGFQQAHSVLERHVKEFNETAPLGYKAEEDQARAWWKKGSSNQYWLLLLIIAIMFLTTSVLFNSLKQPLILIFIIPISFIGVFLTFYFFDLNFDQGGFAAFILLAGLSTNANIYILNEFNNIRERDNRISKMKAYLRAWNAKIRPIFLTIFSTILGFIPFMVGEFKEAFWFPLAAGTIGGLIVSFIALFLYLPLFMGINEKHN